VAPTRVIDDGSTLLARTIVRPTLHRTPSASAAAVAQSASQQVAQEGEPVAATRTKPSRDVLSAVV
jgi:hypothetical protein